MKICISGSAIPKGVQVALHPAERRREAKTDERKGHANSWHNLSIRVGTWVCQAGFWRKKMQQRSVHVWRCCKLTFKSSITISSYRTPCSSFQLYPLPCAVGQMYLRSHTYTNGGLRYGIIRHSHNGVLSVWRHVRSIWSSSHNQTANKIHSHLWWIGPYRVSHMLRCYMTPGRCR